MFFGQTFSVRSQKMIRIALLCLLAVAVTFLLVTSFIRPIAQDEGVFLTIGNSLASGKVPYSDFFDHKPPGIYYLFSLIALTFGKNILVFRVVLLLANLFSALLVFFIAIKIKKGTEVFAALLFLISLIFFEGNYLVAEPFLVFFLLLGLFCLLLYEENKKLPFLILAGFFLAVMCLFKQTAFLSFVPIVLYLIISKYKSKEVALFLLPVALVGLAVLFNLREVFPQAFNQIVTLNFTSYPSENFNTVVKSLSSVFKRTWFLWILFAASLIRKIEDKREILLLLLALLPTLSFFVRGYPHYWIQILPFVAILAAQSFEELLASRFDFLKLVFLAFLIISFYQNLSWYFWVAKNISWPKYREERQVKEYIQNSKGEYLLAENQFTGFYFSNNKKALTKYLYLTEITDTEGATQKTIEALKKNKNTVIVWPTNPDFAYAKELQGYILENCQKEKEFEKIGLTVYSVSEQ